MGLSHVFLVVAVWAFAAIVLWWGDLPPRLRRALALTASAAGLLFLVLGLNTPGRREATTWGVFLHGSDYLTGKVSASASLPYYVVTGLCLLLGTAALALPDSTADALRRHWVASAVGLSIAVTVVRFLLERAAAPALWTWAAGVTALAPLVGAYFWLSARREARPWREVVKALVIYGLATRAWITLMYATVTTLRLGSTHYDVSGVVRARNPFSGTLHVFEPGTLQQVMSLVVLPQLLFWPVYTLVAGLLGALIARLVSRAWTGQTAPAEAGAVAPVEMAPARQD